MVRLLYPSSLLRASVVDEFFAVEAATAVSRPALYDASSGRVLSRGVDVTGEVLVYRGWIASRAEYANMEAAVIAAGARLLVSSAAYAAAQFAPMWLDTFRGFTPVSVVLPYDATDDQLLTAVQSLVAETGVPSLVVKGGSKSVKDDWFNAMFVSGLGDLLRVVGNFRAAVSPESEDTLVLRSFEEWTESQLRLWWVDGSLAFVGPHPQAVGFFGGWTGANVTSGLPPVLDSHPGLVAFTDRLSPLVSALSSPLLVTDVVTASDGHWRVVEVGDGGVSESPVGFSSVLAGTSLASLFDEG